MGKAERQARRQARRTQRKERREHLKRLVTAISNAKITFRPDDDDTQPPFIDVFNQIWPILDPALQYLTAMRITGPNFDDVLTEIRQAGLLVSQGGGAQTENAFRKKFTLHWNKLEWALELVQILTPDKVDDALDDIIEIGDWIAGE